MLLKNLHLQISDDSLKTFQQYFLGGGNAFTQRNTVSNPSSLISFSTTRTFSNNTVMNQAGNIK